MTNSVSGFDLSFNEVCIPVQVVAKCLFQDLVEFSLLLFFRIHVYTFDRKDHIASGFDELDFRIDR